MTDATNESPASSNPPNDTKADTSASPTPVTPVRKPFMPPSRKSASGSPKSSMSHLAGIKRGPTGRPVERPKTAPASAPASASTPETTQPAPETQPPATPATETAAATPAANGGVAAKPAPSAPRKTRTTPKALAEPKRAPITGKWVTYVQKAFKWFQKALLITLALLCINIISGHRIQSYLTSWLTPLKLVTIQRMPAGKYTVHLMSRTSGDSVTYRLYTARWFQAVPGRCLSETIQAQAFTLPAGPIGEPAAMAIATNASIIAFVCNGWYIDCVDLDRNQRWPFSEQGLTAGMNLQNLNTYHNGVKAQIGAEPALTPLATNRWPFAVAAKKPAEPTPAEPAAAAPEQATQALGEVSEPVVDLAAPSLDDAISAAQEPQAGSPAPAEAAQVNEPAAEAAPASEPVAEAPSAEEPAAETASEFEPLTTQETKPVEPAAQDASEFEPVATQESKPAESAAETASDFEPVTTQESKPAAPSAEEASEFEPVTTQGAAPSAPKPEAEPAITLE